MTANASHTLSVADLDAVLPEAFEILRTSHPDMHAPHAVRVVRHTTTGQTYTFQTPRQYLHFVLSVTPRRLLTNVSQTRYIELSSQYDNDVYFHASVTHTVAAAGVSSCSVRSPFSKVNINHYKYVTYSIDSLVSLWYAFSREGR